MMKSFTLNLCVLAFFLVCTAEASPQSPQVPTNKLWEFSDLVFYGEWKKIKRDEIHGDRVDFRVIRIYRGSPVREISLLIPLASAYFRSRPNQRYLVFVAEKESSDAYPMTVTGYCP